VVLAGLVGGCASGDYYRGRVLLVPAGGGEMVDAFGDSLPDGAFKRLGTGRLGHGNFVRTIVYSPDGKTIASWGGDLRCRFWEASSGRLIWASPPWYRRPMFSPDGRHVAMLYSGNIHLVRLDSGKVVRTFRRRTGQVVWAAFAHGGRRLVTISTDRTIRVWSVALGLEMRKIQLEPNAMRVMNVAAIRADGRMLAVSTGYSSVSVCDLDMGRCVRKLKTPKPAWVRSLAFTGADNNVLYGKLHDSKTLFWDLRNGELCDGTEPFSRQGVFAVSPDRRNVAYASGGRIRIEDLQTGRETQTSARTPRCKSVLEMMAFRGDRAGTLITAARDGLWRWDIGTGRDSAMLAGAIGGGKWTAVSADGRLAALLDAGGLAGVYDIRAGKRIALIEGGAEKITAAAFSTDGRTLATASVDSIALWNLPDGTQAGAIALDKSKYLGVASLALSADGKTVVAAVTSPNPQRNNNIRNSKSPAASRAIVPAALRGIEIFDVAAGKCRGRIPGYLFALSPDSRTLAKPGYKCVELWDITAMKPIRTLKCAQAMLSGMMGAMRRLQFSPDGRKLARSIITQTRVGRRSLGEYGCVELFDLAGGPSQILKVDDISAAPVTAFSKDSRTLATAGARGAILLWDISRDAGADFREHP
jgi:WD40 repeat protein